MKKMIGIIIGIVSIVLNMGITVYAESLGRMSIRVYIEDMHVEGLILIGLISIACVGMVYSIIKKKDKKILLVLQILAIIIMGYFRSRIYFTTWTDGVGSQLLAVYLLGIQILPVFVIFELITWKNENLYRKINIIATILLIFMTINLIAVEGIIVNQYNNYRNITSIIDINSK